eukprot:gene12143-biopygen3450
MATNFRPATDVGIGRANWFAVVHRGGDPSLSEAADLLELLARRPVPVYIATVKLIIGPTNSGTLSKIVHWPILGPCGGVVAVRPIVEAGEVTVRLVGQAGFVDPLHVAQLEEDAILPGHLPVDHAGEEADRRCARPARSKGMVDEEGGRGVTTSLGVLHVAHRVAQRGVASAMYDGEPIRAPDANISRWAVGVFASTAPESNSCPPSNRKLVAIPLHYCTIPTEAQ